jgi:hypothetical protein
VVIVQVACAGEGQLLDRASYGTVNIALGFLDALTHVLAHVCRLPSCLPLPLPIGCQ